MQVFPQSYWLKDALSQLHFPSSSDNLSSAIYRLKFDEHFIQQIFLGLVKSKIKYTKSTIFKDIGPYFQKIRDNLSFELTNAQKKVIAEIHSDLKRSFPRYWLFWQIISQKYENFKVKKKIKND